MIKKLSALTLAAGVLAAPAFAKISFSLDIEALTGSDGATQLSSSGLLVLVVDTGGTGDFSGPTTGSLVSGDDEIVATWDLGQVGPGTSDLTLLTEGGVVWDADWSPNDPLALYWFPNLSTSNQSPAANEVYGLFSDSAGIATGDAWMLPVDGTMLHGLKFFTAAASKLVASSNLAVKFPSALGKAYFAIGTAQGVPTVPANVTPSSDGTSINVEWTGGSSGGGGLIVQRRVSGNDAWTTVGFANDGDTSFEDTTIRNGLTYDYRVLSMGGSKVAEGVAPAAIQSERSLITGIAARGYIDNSAPYKLLNGGIILVGNDPEKKIIATGIGPHNEFKFSQSGQWVTDPYLTHNFLGQGVDAESQDWIYDTVNPANPNPDLAAIKSTMTAIANVTELRDDPAVALDAVILEDLPINSQNIFKVQALGADKGFAAIEVYAAEYDVSAGGPGVHDNRIFSISSRSWFPGTSTVAGAVSNGSVTIEGNVPKEVLAIAQGPSILPNDPMNPAILHDPILRLQVPNLGLVTQNDDWDNQTAFSDPAKGVVKVETDMNRIRAALIANNHNPDNFTKDSVLLVTLNPGSYIFRVVPADGTQEYGSVLIALSEYEGE